MGISKYMTKENCPKLDLLADWKEFGEEIIEGKGFYEPMTMKERRIALGTLHRFVYRLLDEKLEEDPLYDP